MASIAATPSAEAIEAVHAPSPMLLWGIALAGCAAAAGCVPLALTSDHLTEPGVQAALMAWVVLPYVLAGVVAWFRRPDSRLGVLMVTGGFTIFLSSLAWANAGVPYTIGIAFDLLPAVVFLNVFLAFPSGRLRGPFERGLVAAGYVTAIGLQLVGMALDGFGDDNLLALTSQPHAADVLSRLQLVVLSVAALTGIGVLVLRTRGADPPLRRSVTLLVDSFVLALLLIAVLLVSGAFGGASGEIPFETTRRVTFFFIGLAPVAFLIGLLHARLARSAVGDLVVELRSDPAPADLRDALARALRDPSLTLAYWLPDFGTYADSDGRRVELPEPGAGRVTTLIERDGAPVTVLLHDRSLEDEPELLSAVTAAAAIALENARLHVELRARLEELRGSRARIVQAGDRERQRLERNLHDGAQQRLVALSLELGLLEGQLQTDSEAKARLDRARGEIAASLAELRVLARGIHPAVVSAHGLAVALEQLAALAPVRVRLTVATEGRLPEALEVAAYYVVSESLANVGKYAKASSATVDVARTGGRVLIEVTDDGVGGADTERGTGLRGLADRVEALGGRLQVWSPVGGGTRVKAEIPCAQ